MSAITIENDLVHYEVLGRGRPVIFVHGWLGSWRYWVPTMQQLSMKYRTYALDLWGFGDSDKNTTRYNLKDQVKLLYDFMEKMGMPKAALVGHSLGAAVCLRFASQYPDRAPRVMLVSPPLFDMGGFDSGISLIDQKPSVAPPKPAVPAPGVPATPASVADAKAPVAPPKPVEPTPGVPAAPASVADAKAPVAPPKPVEPTPGTPAAPAPVADAQAPVAPPKPVEPTPSTPAAPAPVTANMTPASTTPASTYEGETLMHNPLRGLGQSRDEILANMQAKTAAAPTPGQTRPLPPSAPALPTNIGTPLLDKAPPTTGSKTSTAAMPRTDAINPLIIRFTGVKPAVLLAKHLDRDITDADKLRAEVEKTDEEAIAKSVHSFNGVNLAVELQRLTSPTLLLHGKDDPLLPAPSEDLLQQIAHSKPAGHFLPLIEPGLRHFPMLEITVKFNRLLMDFLEAPDLTNIQFKDQWVRMMR